MDILWQELSFGIADQRDLAKIIIRLIASFILGGIIGFEREMFGKPAGLRTHILVSLGTTVFVLGCIGAGMGFDAQSRVIQGIVTGIGFIGAGSILKLETQNNIKGLTTAAGIWMTSAIGVVVGLGELGLAIIATILTVIVLAVISTIEFRAENKKTKEETHE